MIPRTVRARPDWPVISEDDQDLQLSLCAALVKHKCVAPSRYGVFNG